MRVTTKLACGLVGVGATVCLALSGVALWYLQTAETRFKAATGCVLKAESAHLSVGWAAYRREFNAVVIKCPYGQGAGPGQGVGGAFVGYSRTARIELAVWHPFSVQISLAGGQKLGGAQQPAVFFAQASGAALQVSVPLWQKGAGHAVTFWSDFQRVSIPNGLWAGYGATVQQVRGKLVWNTQATAQESVVGVAFTARNAALSVWKDNVADVSFAAAIPGPVMAHQAVWQAWQASMPTHAVLPLPPADFLTPDIVVQTLSGVWRGMRVGWSARLWVLPPADIEGESWVTLPSWPALLDALRAKHTLTPQQQEALLKFENSLAQQHGAPQGPFTLPLAVRGGQVRLGPCRMSVQQLSCPDFF